MRVLTIDQMREVEKKALDKGIGVNQLIQTAGVNLAKVILSKKNHLPKSVIGLVGTGNNGGDALIALAVLAKSGWEAHAYLLQNRQKEDEAFNWFIQVGGKVTIAHNDNQFSVLGQLISNSTVLIDGFLGTGIKLPLKKEIDAVLGFIKKQARLPYIYAVDCPSGVDCSSGSAADSCLRADETVCMGAVKTGLLKFPAFALVGELSQVEIGVPEKLFDDQCANRFVVGSDAVSLCMPDRPLDSHKGTFGKVLIVGGSIMFPGAPMLAAKAAYKIGAGLVQVASSAAVQQMMACSCPEATWFVLPSSEGVIDGSASEVIRKQLIQGTATALGMGMGHEDTTIKFLEQLLPLQQKSKKEHGIGFISATDSGKEPEMIQVPPLVIDADGLRTLSRLGKWRDKIPPDTILTPHIGEMSILTGLSKDEIKSARWEIAEKYAKEWKCVVVLKGAITIIADPDGKLAIIPIAAPALAKAGSGDVLAGVICGLRAQGLAAFQAAWCGAWIHGRAGILAEQVFGNNTSAAAGDIIHLITNVLAELKSKKPGLPTS